MKVHRTLRAVPSFAALTLLAMASASPALARHSGSSHHSGSSSSHSSGPSSFHGGSPGGSHGSRASAFASGGASAVQGGQSDSRGREMSTPRGSDGPGSFSGGAPPASNPGGSAPGGNSGNGGGSSNGWHGGDHGSHNGGHGNNHDGGHHGNGFHNGGGFHGGGFHGGGGFGFRGYYYPSFWGSIFLGYPYPSWYYGPWGYYGAGYGYYGDGYRDRQEQGALDLDLSPADTQVYLNGQYIGVVDDFDGWPQYLWLDPGTYDIVFYREGYKTLARQVTVYRGLVIDWDDKLEHGPSIRPEDLPSATHERRDARVEQDREMKEKAERGGDSWRDRVRGERYRHDRGDDRNGRDDRGERNDRGSENAPPTAPRSGEAGRLHLAIDPHDASVYLDGRFLGTADDVSRLSSGLLVDPGSHTLSVVRPGRHAEERQFEVRPGEQVDLRIELKGE